MSLFTLIEVYDDFNFWLVSLYLLNMISLEGSNAKLSKFSYNTIVEIQQTFYLIQIFFYLRMYLMSFKVSIISLTVTSKLIYKQR